MKHNSTPIQVPFDRGCLDGEQSQAMEHHLGQLLAEVERNLGQQAATEEATFGAESTAEEGLSAAERREIDELFDLARKDRTRAFELKQTLDRLGMFKEYEDRFLDLFRQSEPGA